MEGNDEGDDALVLEGDERNLTWLWDKVRDSSSGGMNTAKCEKAVETFHTLLSSCIEEVDEAADNPRKLDLLRRWERDARSSVSTLLSGQASLLLDGKYFSCVSKTPLPAAVFGARTRNARRPERFCGQNESD